MPYAITKSGKKYLLKNTETGAVKGTHDSMQKAQSQMRLLNAIEHNPNFKQKKK